MIIIVLTLLILLFVFAHLGHIFWICYRIDKTLSHVPGPPGLPIFRNYFEFNSIEKVIPRALECQRVYGPMVKINLFLVICGVLLTDCKVIEFILGGTHILNKTTSYTFLHEWLGSGLLTSKRTAGHNYKLIGVYKVLHTDNIDNLLDQVLRKLAPRSSSNARNEDEEGNKCALKHDSDHIICGEKWKKTRKIITPAFHFQILEQYVDVFHSASEQLMRKLKERVGKGSFDVYPYITLCTLDIICETAMGTKINAQENSDSKYVHSVKEMCRIIIDRTKSPLKAINGLYRLSRDYWKEKLHVKVIHGFTNSIIKKRREELLNKGVSTAPQRRLAFLDLILQSTIDGRPMTGDEIRQEVDTFMFEGHDTTASGICFTLYCLAKNADVQKKVYEELVSIFGSDKQKAAKYKDLRDMKYLEMVIKESLRLYPAVPIFSRQPDGDKEYYGGVLPDFAQIGIFVYGLHRNPEYYPEPEKFDPERFTLENQTKRPPFSYLAFSAGPRNCIGQKFAMLELKMVVSKILRTFELLPVLDYEPRLAPLVVLRSLNGILIKLEQRRTNA